MWKYQCHPIGHRFKFRVLLQHVYDPDGDSSIMRHTKFLLWCETWHHTLRTLKNHFPVDRKSSHPCVWTGRRIIPVTSNYFSDVPAYMNFLWQWFLTLFLMEMEIACVMYEVSFAIFHARWSNAFEFWKCDCRKWNTEFVQQEFLIYNVIDVFYLFHFIARPLERTSQSWNLSWTDDVDIRNLSSQYQFCRSIMLWNIPFLTDANAQMILNGQTILCILNMEISYWYFKLWSMICWYLTSEHMHLPYKTWSENL